MENLLFLGVPILKHIEYLFFYFFEKEGLDIRFKSSHEAMLRPTSSKNVQNTYHLLTFFVSPKSKT